MPSPVLGKPISYSVYLPNKAEAPGAKRPLLFLLHGKGDDETAWARFGNAVATLDRKIAAGEMQPMIVVMPNAEKSWYVDDTRANGFGAYFRAFRDDLFPAIEKRYGTSPCREARAIAGLSMGGYGAVLHAFSEPDTFSAAISFSGSLFSEEAADLEARRANYGRIYDGVMGEPFEPKRFLDWNVFMRLKTGSVSPATTAVWLMAGDDDYPSILSGTVRMHQELKRRGVPTELRIVDGGHTWEAWGASLDPALGWLSQRLDATCGAGTGKR